MVTPTSTHSMEMCTPSMALVNTYSWMYHTLPPIQAWSIKAERRLCPTPLQLYWLPWQLGTSRDKQVSYCTLTFFFRCQNFMFWHFMQKKVSCLYSKMIWFKIWRFNIGEIYNFWAKLCSWMHKISCTAADLAFFCLIKCNFSWFINTKFRKLGPAIWLIKKNVCKSHDTKTNFQLRSVYEI